MFDSLGTESVQEKGCGFDLVAGDEHSDNAFAGIKNVVVYSRCNIGAPVVLGQIVLLSCATS